MTPFRAFIFFVFSIIMTNGAHAKTSNSTYYAQLGARYITWGKLSKVYDVIQPQFMVDLELGRNFKEGFGLSLSYAQGFLGLSDATVGTHFNLFSNYNPA